MRCLPRNSWLSWEFASILHVLSEVTWIEIIRVEWAVRPPSRSWVATADEVTAKTLFSLDCKKRWIAVVSNVFPVPPGAMRKKRSWERWLVSIGTSSKSLIDNTGKTELITFLKAFCSPELKCWLDSKSRYQIYSGVCCCVKVVRGRRLFCVLWRPNWDMGVLEIVESAPCKFASTHCIAKFGIEMRCWKRNLSQISVMKMLQK